MADLFADLVPGQDLYDLGPEIGHGAYSEVYKATERASGTTVALKQMYLSEEGVLPPGVRREVAALRRLAGQPHILRLLDVRMQGYAVALVLEYCLTDLYRLTRAGKALPPPAAKAAAAGLLRALAACHAAGIVHRDVAPTNLLVGSDGVMKLSDFGQAAAAPGAPPLLDDAQHAASDGGGTPGAGTRWYKAPEVLLGCRSYAPAVDAWAAGCLLAELLRGSPLFPGNSDIGQLCLIFDALGTPDEASWPGLGQLPDWGKLAFPQRRPAPLGGVLPGAPPAAVALVAGLLRLNPAGRLSPADALRSSWFTEAPAEALPEELLALASPLADG